MSSQKLVIYIYIYLINILDIVDTSRFANISIKDTWANSQLTNQEIKLICEAIKGNENIQTLNLSNS